MLTYLTPDEKRDLGALLRGIDVARDQAERAVAENDPGEVIACAGSIAAFALGLSALAREIVREAA